MTAGASGRFSRGPWGIRRGSASLPHVRLLSGVRLHRVFLEVLAVLHDFAGRRPQLQAAFVLELVTAAAFRKQHIFMVSLPIILSANTRHGKPGEPVLLPGLSRHQSHMQLTGPCPWCPDGSSPAPEPSPEEPFLLPLSAGGSTCSLQSESARGQILRHPDNVEPKVRGQGNGAAR